MNNWRNLPLNTFKQFRSVPSLSFSCILLKKPYGFSISWLDHTDPSASASKIYNSKSHFS